tara:strand:+ start:64950 stop:65825 length:876 start_codon:yes stop_codon:yes gene_type:complete
LTALTKPKITAISPWYGSKRILAPRIVELLGDHKMYYEPFCGSMAVLLAKPAAQYETACDLHQDLTNMAKVLADHDQAVELYDRLTRTLFSQALFEQSRDYLMDRPDDPDPLDWAYHFFIHSWAGRNGVSGSKRMSFSLAMRWTPTGGSATTRFRSAIESIPWWHDRLRSVVILNWSAWDMIPKIPDRGDVAVYCDPPYLIETRTGGDADGGYRHDFSGIEHRRLAKLLNAYQHTRIVISYYAHPCLSELYPPEQWDHLNAAINKNLHVQNKRGAKPGKAPEVLIVNKKGI